MNTTESNKLIAEFMGNKPFGKDNFNCDMYSNPMNDISYDRYRKDVLTAPEFEYHTSWDWLMPVVKKCREIMNDFGIESMEYDFLENDIFQTDYTLIDFLNADIDCINERVVRFIKWYNENKED